MRPRLAVLRLNGDRLALAIALLAGAVLGALSTSDGWAPSYFAGSAGLFAIHERLRPEFGRAVAIATTILLFAATSMFWHMTHPSGLRETAAFALVAGLVYLAHQRAATRPLAWILALVVPIVLYALPSPNAARVEAHVQDALFSSTNGLFSLTPVVYLAFVGGLLYIRRNPVAAVGALGVFAAWLLLRGMLGQPRGPEPFSHHLSGALALFAPGLALLVHSARRRPMLALTPLVLAALVWNYWLMVQYTIGTLPKDAPISFSRMVQQQADVVTRSPFIYPFAFPANVWFAWRQGVPAERYDVLAGEPWQRSVDLPLDGRSDRFLLDGWEAPGSDSRSAVRWIGFTRASIALPLDLPASRPVRVIITARARLDEPAVNAEVGVEMNGHAIGKLVASPTVASDSDMTIPAAAVGRILRAGYNRLTFVSYGVHPIDAASAGALPAPRTRDRAWPVAIYRIRIAPD